ncbi:ACP S-malonyltransferase [Bacillus cereus]|uniref:ACP S-malonyltransferase n=1 Tax=Bacillus cereus TaxID=1396 RepID=UPI0037F36F7A
MKVCMFPGQGSQKRGMGQELFDEFIDYTNVASDILGYSIKDLCLNDSENLLIQTQYTQPALYVVNALYYFKYLQEEGAPDYVIGHSLGEYNALLAAGAYSFETGLKLVKKRGELMSKVTGGGMAAVVGLSKEDINEILAQHRIVNVDIANLNTPKQIVLSGPKDEIERIKPLFDHAGAKLFMPLSVSGPFHSRYMKVIEDEYNQYINRFLFNTLSIPVISNVSALPYGQEETKKILVKQISNSVRWTETIQHLMNLNVEDYKEIGPGNVLTGLVNKIKVETTKEDLEKLKIKEMRNLTTTEIIQTVGKDLGDPSFKDDYNVKYPYVVGSMTNGISSVNLVVQSAQNEILSYLGTNGLSYKEIRENLRDINERLANKWSYGCNLLADVHNPQKENELVDIFLQNNVRCLEASGFWSVSPSLIKYRAKGLKKSKNGNIQINNKILIKLTRSEVAKEFLSPISKQLLHQMVEQGEITYEEADMLKHVPIVDDICVMGDCGGPTDHGNLNLLLPSIIHLRDSYMSQYKFVKNVRIGAGGGIGTPTAAAVAFMLGADFILTGSINQCTVEAATSDYVKDMLQNMEIQDTTYVPSEYALDTSGYSQVVRKGVFFPARANRLYDLLKSYGSISEIDSKTRLYIEEKYFGKSFEEILQDELKKNDRYRKNSKQELQIILKWYMEYAKGLAIQGKREQKVNFHIYCGPALGAFNEWVKDTYLENWRNRNVNGIAEKIMIEAVEILEDKKTFVRQT